MSAAARYYIAQLLGVVQKGQGNRARSYSALCGVPRESMLVTEVADPAGDKGDGIYRIVAIADDETDAAEFMAALPGAGPPVAFKEWPHKLDKLESRTRQTPRGTMTLFKAYELREEDGA